MKQHNAENEPAKKTWEGFSCDLFQSPKPIESFECWLDQQLEELEKKFAHNVTVNSARNDVKAGR